MWAHNYTSISNVTNLLSKSCLCTDLKDSPNEHFNDDCENFEEMYDLDGLEEVFADHILMKKRLQKTLYAGGFDDLDDLPDHPPLALTGLALELFSKAVPNYGLDILDMDYVAATSEAARISPCAMIIAMIYLERLQIKNNEYLENVSPPGLFVVTMLVASKFLFEDEEDIVTNQMWAEVLNFDVKELNSLEHDFLSAIKWKVFVSKSEYLRWLDDIERVIAIKQSSLRNWSSYSDMNVIMKDPGFQRLFKTFLDKIVKTTVLWSLGYVATAVALYCTGMALQKFKTERLHSQDFVLQNNSIKLQTSLHSSVGNFYSSDELPSNTQVIEQSLYQPLLFLESSEENIRNQIRNSQSCSITFKRKSCVYMLEITNAFLSQKLGISSAGYFFRNRSLLNETKASSMAWLKIRQKRCVPVLMR
ncbi:protein CNPPD1-like [Argiope bruennichi]|uniref:protein CNPPD1-like n=1 Tax=Argiope bruennichi TaxID=94029 RepID=UPI0024959BCE|nr:protein CNPPD1-like [Argiope bruennichi]